MKLLGKVAIVSGSGRGIGRAIALALAREGAHVVVNDLDPDPAASVAEEIRGAGGASQAVVCAGSVTEAGFAERFVSTALQQSGGLDIIVNNAGYAWDGVIQKQSDEQFDAMLDVHLRAPFHILRAASAHFRETARLERAQGREVFRKVVNVSSIAGTEGSAGQVGYATGKAGVIGMTKTLAREWGRYRINVNAVAYGFVATRMTQAVEGAAPTTVQVGTRSIPAGIPTALVDALEARIPLGRGATPEEAAGAALLLCLPESNYITGHVLMATGGL